MIGYRVQISSALACLLQVVLQVLKDVHLLDRLLQLQVMLVDVDEGLAGHATVRLGEV